MGRTLQRGGVCRFVERGVSLERAIELACEVPMIRRTEIVSLDEARGRVLAAGLASKVDDPRFDNSAMDGFAVRAEDCTSSGTKLEIVGTSQAGSMDLPVVRKGQGCRIMTGAPIPEGADAIVMVEDTEIEGEHVIINGPVRPGYIRRRAENLSIGQEALPEGTQLSSASLALAGTMGHGVLEVIEKPRIAILSTGDELISAGGELKSGQIYESNSHALASLVEAMGCQAIRLESANDSMDELRQTLDSLTDYDAILTSGGVSMGEWDLVRKIMEEEGEISFWRMKLRPGGPPLFGTWKNTPLFGLPGNPVSSLVVFHVLVAPWIAKLLGYHEEMGPRISQQVSVRLADDVSGAPGKLCLRRIRITSENGELIATTHTHQGSGNIHSMIAHNGLTLLPPDIDGKADEVIDALWLL
uniref:molybdopterin molybdotransferase n=1 Tax=uncultured marine group II/III euryarchaeote KM3_172_F11 TaxID=1457929 RepID=A0A075GJW0_9EURY|nr:molybdopterin molybdochelatase (moeA) [uncultured marine group II/III euryarchaeote KM3_172_F11]